MRMQDVNTEVSFDTHEITAYYILLHEGFEVWSDHIPVSGYTLVSCVEDMLGFWNSAENSLTDFIVYEVDEDNRVVLKGSIVECDNKGHIEICEAIVNIEYHEK